MVQRIGEGMFCYTRIGEKEGIIKFYGRRRGWEKKSDIIKH